MRLPADLPAWLPLLLTALSGAAMAQTPPELPALERCATIGAATDRLACYDKAMGRAPAPEAPPAYVGDPAKAGNAVAPAASSSLLTPKNAPVEGREASEGPHSLMSKYWELDPADKRGVFNFVGYKANYVLPLHWTNRINRSPQSPSQPVVEQPNYRHEEAKFQLSLRTKLAQDFLLPDADLWVAYTQQAMWQIWNGKDSKPFRNSDYEPELMYVVPMPKGLRALPWGWQWRYAMAGIAHQSNGQSDPLSRSWNRVNIAAGFERGDWSLVTRLTQRLNEPAASDNNPDLVGFRGRGEFQLNWAHGKHTASLLYRSTLKNVKYGALQFEWTYPVFPDQPNGLRWYVQAFRGYGETMTDYNFRQTSIGGGLSFLQF